MDSFLTVLFLYHFGRLFRLEGASGRSTQTPCSQCEVNTEFRPGCSELCPVACWNSSRILGSLFKCLAALMGLYFSLLELWDMPCCSWWSQYFGQAALWRAWLPLHDGNFMGAGRLPQVTYKPSLLQTQNVCSLHPPQTPCPASLALVECSISAVVYSGLRKKEQMLFSVYWLHSS